MDKAFPALLIIVLAELVLGILLNLFGAGVGFALFSSVFGNAGIFSYAAGAILYKVAVLFLLLIAFVSAGFGVFAYIATKDTKTLKSLLGNALLILAALLLPNLIPAEAYSAIREGLRGVYAIFRHIWWFAAFLILFPLFRSAWLGWRQENFLHRQKYVVLEIRVPREIEIGPYAMDQALQTIYRLSNLPGHFQEEYIDGEVARPFTFEVISFGGEIHFYVRGYHKVRHLIEAAISSAYPAIELIEVDDFMNKLPSTYSEIKQRGYSLWSAEMKLAREPAFPTRIYTDFERPDEDTQLDPMGSLLEVLSKTKKDEVLALQFNVIAAPADWGKEWAGAVEKLKNPPKGEEQSIAALFKTARQTEVIKKVEENLATPAFDSVIRVFYLSPSPLFYDSYPRRGILGAFNQYGAADLNSFLVNPVTINMKLFWYKPYIFPKLRAIIAGQRSVMNFRNRVIPPQTFIGRVLTNHPFSFNKTQWVRITTSVLATIFHPPMKTVLTAPVLKRAESRTAGPSVGLPIYGEEKSIEKFQ